MTVEVISAPPSSFSVYSRALLSATKRGRKPQLPDRSLVLSRATTDRDRLAAYCDICGFRAGDVMPPTWPHILAFPLRMTLMGDARFPFPLLGLVHVKNQTVQQRAIGIDEPLRIECGLGPTEPHEKGIKFTLISTASVAGQDVWRDESTILYRTQERIPGEVRSDQDDQPVQQPTSSMTWSLPSDLGRRYGRVSGDLNPIHLHPLSARAFGFPRAIAHGMWSAAHGLASLDAYEPNQPLTYSVWFKLPIFLPSTVSYRQESTADGARFEVRDEQGEKPHVRGLLVRGMPATEA